MHTTTMQMRIDLDKTSSKLERVHSAYNRVQAGVHQHINGRVKMTVVLLWVS